MTHSLLGGSARIAGGSVAGIEAERRSVILHADRAHLAFAGNDEPVIESFHLVDRALAGNRLAAFAQFGEGRHVAEHRVLESDFGERALLLADDDGGSGDVLEARVLNPELVGIARVDIDGRRHVAEGVADEGQAGLMFADGGFALALEGRIDQRELPGGRGLFREDAVAAAVEVQILGLVADLVERGQAGADVEVHVS